MMYLKVQQFNATRRDVVSVLPEFAQLETTLNEGVTNIQSCEVELSRSKAGIVVEKSDREADRLATACQAMAARFLDGGRLLAFGRGVYGTDAQHVSVEFIHPVIVGKRALPAMDLSALFHPWTEAIVQPQDIVMGFGPPGGDRSVLFLRFP